jgi:plastocyanin
VVSKKAPVWLLSLLVATGLTVLVASPAGARPAAGDQTFTVHLDAQAHNGEPWAFLKIFPNAIQVHSGDVIHAAWAGTDTPHTATFVNTSDPEGWRAQNQGPGGPYEVSVPDSQIGGDDQENVVNPSVLFPAPLGCGQKGIACAFDGTSVVTSGVNFPIPGAQPGFLVKVTAPVGSYSLLCLLHPGMEIPVDVVPTAQPIPTPQAVREEGADQADQANRVDGVQADALAQQVTVTTHGHGHSLWTISAGGFFDNVSANEYVNSGLTVRVGDQIQVNGNFEIHTATFPASAAATVPFIQGQCEVPGPDVPAQTPADCVGIGPFQVAFNPLAVAPTASNRLRDPTEFVNSGLLVNPLTATFVAARPGTYTIVCLVHGPEMTATITVEN